MPPKIFKPKLIYFIVITLLLVGLIPLVVSGWLSASRSAGELRAAENRYQTQLVQNKARQIESFGTHYAELVKNFSQALEIADDLKILSAAQTENNLQATLKENPNLLAFFIKPVNAEPLAVFRPEQISRRQIETLTAETLAKLNARAIVFGKPQSLTAGGELVLPIAAPVFINEKLAAAAVAIVSLKGFQQIINETRPQTEAELWQAGLPIIFVVEESGQAVFHPDAQLTAERRDLVQFENRRRMEKFFAFDRIRARAVRCRIRRQKLSSARLVFQRRFQSRSAFRRDRDAERRQGSRVGRRDLAQYLAGQFRAWQSRL